MANSSFLFWQYENKVVRIVEEAREKVKVLVGDLNDFFLFCSFVTVVMAWYFRKTKGCKVGDRNYGNQKARFLGEESEDRRYSILG